LVTTQNLLTLLIKKVLATPPAHNNIYVSLYGKDFARPGGQCNNFLFKINELP